MEFNPALWSEVTSIIEEMTGVGAEGLTPETSFDELGFDSLTTVEIAVAAEQRLGVQIADDELVTLQTVGDAASCIAKLIDQDSQVGAAAR
jgi:acyl carrier protein